MPVISVGGTRVLVVMSPPGCAVSCHGDTASPSPCDMPRQGIGRPTDVSAHVAAARCAHDQLWGRGTMSMTTCDEVRDDPTQVVLTDDCLSTDDVVRPGTRYLLRAFAVLPPLAPHQLGVFGDRTERFWPWTIHSRASVGFLAAAYAAGFVLSVLALRERSWRRVRVAVATVTVFTLLTLVPTLLHAHRLHLTDPDPI